MNYLAIDLEMTGLNVKKDHILEIGAVCMRDGEPHNTFSVIVNPHCTLPTQITDLTGITQQMADEGEELSDVLPRFVEFCGSLPLLGHNLLFDYTFLKQACVNTGLPFEKYGIDTLRLARRFLPAGQKKKLTALRELYQLDTGMVHRAASDALAAALVYERLLSDYGETDPDAFSPVPLLVNIKKQQPVTIPQKEQLTRLLSVSSTIVDKPVDIDHLTRSEASRLIERLLHAD